MRKVNLKDPCMLQEKLFDLYKRARIDWHSCKFSLEFLDIKVEDNSIVLELGSEIIHKDEIFETFFSSRLIFKESEVFIKVRPSNKLVFITIIYLFILLISILIEVETFYFFIVNLVLFFPYIIYRFRKGYISFNNRLDRFFANI